MARCSRGRRPGRCRDQNDPLLFNSAGLSAWARPSSTPPSAPSPRAGAKRRSAPMRSSARFDGGLEHELHRLVHKARPERSVSSRWVRQTGEGASWRSPS